MIRKLTVVGLSGLLALSVLAGPAAARTNCLVQVINAEKALYGTDWGRDAVSQLARNPELFEGARNLGEIARFLAQASPDACPLA